MGDDLKSREKRLAQWLGVILDHVDYTSGSCGPTEMIGACLPKQVIVEARALLASPEATEPEARAERFDRLIDAGLHLARAHQALCSLPIGSERWRAEEVRAKAIVEVADQCWEARALRLPLKGSGG